jgi:urea ABC transporter permease protein UrtC/urea ABC transporter ATP-binding protein UrtD
MSEVNQAVRPSTTSTARETAATTVVPVPSTRASIGFDIWLALLVALVGVPCLWYKGFIQIDLVNTLGRFLAFAIVAVSLDLLWGYTGILCLCQSLFFALGGYAMGMYLAMHGPLDGAVPDIPRCLFVVTSAVQGFQLPWFWRPFNYLALALPLGLLIPGLFGFIVGYFGFASRVRGVYFSILTIAVTKAAWLVFCMNNMLLCGTNGLTNFEKLAGFDLREPKVKMAMYIITLLALAAVYGLCYWLTGSRLGRVLIAIRDNESRLRFSGYKPHHFKVFVFVVAAMIAGLGGMLYATQSFPFTPEYMTNNYSNLVVAWVAVGGRGRLKGAVFGALLVNLVYNYLTSVAPDFWPFVLGGLYIGAAVFLHEGMINLRGGLYLAWLFAAPPIWKLADFFLPRDLTGGETAGLAVNVLYVGHWAAWAMLGGFVIWLLFDKDRINRPLKVLGQWFLARIEPIALASGPLGAMILSRKATANGVDAAAAGDTKTPTASDDDLQKRLSRIAAMTRVQRPIAPEGSLLKVKNTKVLFDGFKALDIESLELNPFELRVIIGPNGAGKTTLCDVISGKTRPAEGSVTFANALITGLSEAEIARRGVGRKFQTPTVFNSLTVFENMELALPGRQALYRCFVSSATAAETEKIFSILRRVRLAEHANRQVQYLSHGQRQWLEISMLILAAPMLLLVDEPAAGLTDEETVLTAEMLLELQEEHSIIVIEHDMEFVRLLGSRVTVLNEGQVMADGTLEEVKKDPKVIEAYLGR